MILVNPDRHLSGKFTATWKYGSKEANKNIFVVQKLQKALLGRLGIESLNLIARINSLQEEKFVAMYPNLFKGLGTIMGEYHISLQDRAKPFAILTPTRIPLPLMQGFERMEAMGVITRIEQPTDWCAGIVIVPEPNGNLWICVDLTKLNENIR